MHADRDSGHRHSRLRRQRFRARRFCKGGSSAAGPSFDSFLVLWQRRGHGDGEVFLVDPLPTQVLTDYAVSRPTCVGVVPWQSTTPSVADAQLPEHWRQQMKHPIEDADRGNRAHCMID